jgi:putative DNA primase/helicase
VYVTNRLPVVKGDDPAVWRRIRVIPFHVVIPQKDWDLTLPERLALHADAILTWVVVGHFDHEDNGGMREPKSVVQATGKYKVDSDAITRFIEAECLINEHMFVTVAELWDRWSGWRVDDGADDISKKAFGEAMDRRGYPSQKERGTRVRRGITLQGKDEERPE